jgi:hypothetical protein
LKQLGFSKKRKLIKNSQVFITCDLNSFITLFN